MNKIIIYGSTKERAYEKLDQILNDMRYGDVKRVRKSDIHFSVELKNGDCYLALATTDNARGHRWQYAFVDRLISEEMLDNVVFAKFIPKDKNGKLDSSMKIKDRYKWF